MTNPAEVIQVIRPTPARDRWGRYEIVHPVTGKAEGYQRVTTFASLIADEFNINQWRLRAMLKGLVDRPDLMLLAASLVDPVDEQKSEANKITADAIDAGKADAKANMGTALHSFTEQVDEGHDPKVPAPYDADIRAYTAELARCGFKVIDIERVVVNFTDDYCGTLDRILLHVPTGKLYIGDLKTGKQPHFYPHEICIQLACYANGEYLYNVAEDRCEPMPVGLQRNRALVIHLPPGSGQCDLYWFNTQKGAAMIETVKSVRAFRKLKSKDLVKPFDDSEIVLARFPGAELSGPTKALPEPETNSEDESEASTVVVDPATYTTGHNGGHAPIGTAQDGPNWITDSIETNKAVQDGTYVPPPPPAPLDEGPEVDEADKKYRKVRADLSKSQRAVIDKWIKQATTAGVGFRVSELGSLRRFTLHRAMVYMVQACTTDDGTVDQSDCEAMIRQAIETELPLGGPAGKFLGKMTIEQAAELATISKALRDGTATIKVDDNDRMIIVPDKS